MANKTNSETMVGEGKQAKEGKKKRKSKSKKKSVPKVEVEEVEGVE